MIVPATEPADRTRQLLFLTTPALWPAWPFLPVVRRTEERGEELGVVADVVGLGGPTGYSAAVFLCNLFALPATLGEFLSLPREVYDAADEVLAAGWRVD